ncbi:MAG: DUF302 domain-containing protein [Bacteroidales bacterium]|jgi:uncharacterized protein (DUF302 family)|nr:DUF302 domain-containing protein [Bacteroidales bacterium]
MFVENYSRYDFNTTVKLLEDAVIAAGWSVLHRHNLNDILRNKGFEVLPVSVIEVCKSSLSVKILERDSERRFSSLMPCRISIYETSDGRVKISRLDAGKLAGVEGGVAGEVMGVAFDEMESIIAPLLLA